MTPPAPGTDPVAEAAKVAADTLEGLAAALPRVTGPGSTDEAANTVLDFQVTAHQYLVGLLAALKGAGLLDGVDVPDLPAEVDVPLPTRAHLDPDRPYVVVPLADMEHLDSARSLYNDAEMALLEAVDAVTVPALKD